MSHNPPSMRGFCPLASGSKGNCIYIGTERTKILIDAGIGIRTLKERLQLLGVQLEEIEAILITHEHIDHIRGLEPLTCRMGIPVFCNSETALAILPLLKDKPKFKLFSTGETFSFADVTIHPFTVPHDAVDPVAYTLTYQAIKMGFCADLGWATSLIASHLKACDYLYLEANHEPSMVHASARPEELKKRILGRQGHLSNAQCAQLIEQIYHPGLKHIHLAHLSGECNAPEVALRTVQSKIAELNGTTEVSIAFQEKSSRPILFTEESSADRTPSAAALPSHSHPECRTAVESC